MWFYQGGKKYRINRNIVECKDFAAERNAQFSKVLIETLWNVKYLTGVIYGCLVEY